MVGKSPKHAAIWSEWCEFFIKHGSLNVFFEHEAVEALEREGYIVSHEVMEYEVSYLKIKVLGIENHGDHYYCCPRRCDGN